MTEAEQEWSLVEGLEYCKNKRRYDKSCAKCPYAGFGCAIDAAIVKLKAQEPRVMTLEEVRALQDGAVVWLEDNDKADVIPGIVNHVWNNLPNIVSFTVVHMREVKADMLWYGIKWRCWTSRPDEIRRAETPWN